MSPQLLYVPREVPRGTPTHPLKFKLAWLSWIIQWITRPLWVSTFLVWFGPQVWVYVTTWADVVPVVQSMACVVTVGSTGKLSKPKKWSQGSKVSWVGVRNHLRQGAFLSTKSSLLPLHWSVYKCLLTLLTTFWPLTAGTLTKSYMKNKVGNCLLHCNCQTSLQTM